MIAVGDGQLQRAKRNAAKPAQPSGGQPVDKWENLPADLEPKRQRQSTLLVLKVAVECGFAAAPKIPIWPANYRYIAVQERKTSLVELGPPGGVADDA